MTDGKNSMGSGFALSDIDTTTPHPARMYNAYLGSKDNISQVVSAVLYNCPTGIIQTCQTNYSKIESSAVRDLSGPSLGTNVRFIRRVFLTLA